MECSLAEPADTEAPPTTLRILVSDDQPDVLEALRLLLKGAGYQAATVDSPGALLGAASQGGFDLILMDMNYTRDTTSGKEGLDLLARLHAQGCVAPVIVMTAWGDVELAVEAMRRGASDFVQKPWDNARLLSTIAKQAQAATRARSELEIARQVQEKLFPQAIRPLATLDYAGRCVPAREVGGDYYDFLDLGPGQEGIVLADVSGKGIAAALLMANLQAMFRSQPDLARRDPCGLLQLVNRLLFESTPAEHYATLFFASYDDRTRRLRYVNCGHQPPLLVRDGGGVERLDSSSTVLGMFPRWRAEEREIQLAPGDTLVLVSDGVTDAGIEQGREFGEEGLMLLVESLRRQPPARIADAVIAAVRGAQNDDLTVVALQCVK